MKVYKCLPTAPVEDPFKLSYKDILKEHGVYKSNTSSAYFIVVDGPDGGICALHFSDSDGCLQVAVRAWDNTEIRFKKVNNAKVFFDVKED